MHTYIHTCIRTYVQYIHACMHIHTFVHTCIHTYTCCKFKPTQTIRKSKRSSIAKLDVTYCLEPVNVYTYIHIYAYMHTCIHIHAYMHIHISCINTCIHAYTYMHIHAYIHAKDMHTSNPASCSMKHLYLITPSKKNNNAEETHIYV